MNNKDNEKKREKDIEDILDQCDHIIEQPLLTEEGFINEACMNELAAAIKNMPEAYDRLSGDPEWNTPRWTRWRHIVSGVAQWAIRNISDDRNDEEGKTVLINSPVFPPGLENVLGYLGTCLRKDKIFDELGYANLSLCQINKMLHDILMEDGSVFVSWNTEETMGEAWLDLSALLHNACLSIRDERRDNDRFDARFKAEHGELPGE